MRSCSVLAILLGWLAGPLSAGDREMLFEQGDQQLRKGDFDGAIVIFSRVLEAGPKDFRALGGRAYAYAKKNEWASAVDDLTEAIRVNPVYGAGYAMRASVYALQGKLCDALTDFNTAERLNAADKEVYRNRGEIYATLGDLPRAIADYTRAIHLDPKFGSAYEGRASVYAMQDKFADALADLSEAEHLGGVKKELLFYWRGYIHVREDPEKAIAEYTEAIRLNEKFNLAYAHRGAAYARIGELTKALADLDEAERLGCAPENLCMHRGYIYFHQGSLKKSLLEYTRAITLTPKAPQGGLQSQSQPVGGVFSKKTSAGVRKPRHARGRLLSSFSTRRTS